MTKRVVCLVSIVVAFGAAGLGCTLASHGDHEGSSAPAPEPQLSSGSPTDYSSDAASPAFDFDAIGGNSSSDPSDATSDAGTMEPVGDASGPVTGQIVYGLDDLNQLVRFGTASPSSVSVIPITGMSAGEWMLGVDFRPKTGALYGMSNTTKLYTINTTTGAATDVGPSATPQIMGQAHGFDFDPVADHVRMHTDVDENLRVDPQTGTVTADPMLAFASGDPNFEQSPNLVGTAYTNSVSGAATTTLYAIDSTRNLLAKLATPNTGVIETIGSLGVDFDQAAGFDIWGKDPKMEGFAALTASGKTSLYTIDLKSGAATLVGPIAHARPLVGIAIAP